MSLCCTRRNDVHKSAFVKSSFLRWILGDHLLFKGSLPRPDYIHRLIEHFRESSSPESMRRVTVIPGNILREYVYASCHLPGAYVEFFPCPHCTHTAEADDDYVEHFVEVFHFANVHHPTVCATVTFIRTAFIVTVRPDAPSGLFGVEFTRGCPNAPTAVDHSQRVVPHVHTDVFIEVLRFLSRSELETALLVSRRWSNVIGWAEGSLQQRRRFNMFIKFYGESPGMLIVHFLRRELSGQERNLRTLATRGLSQALYAVHSHLRNAFVEAAVPFFLDSIPPPGPPREMLVDIPLPLRINWLMSLLHSMPLNSVIDCWSVKDTAIGFDNFLPLVRCVPKTHRKLGCVRELELCLSDRDATWARLVSLLNQPNIRGFNEVTISTTVTIDSSELLTILKSRQSPRLHLVALSEIEPQDPLLTLPEQLIQDFVALSDVSSFVTEFSLRFAGRNDIVIPEMPATNQRKQFRCHLLGVDTVARVHVYANRAARECLTVVTFDHFRRTVHFFKGNVTLADLKLAFRRICPYF